MQIGAVLAGKYRIEICILTKAISTLFALASSVARAQPASSSVAAATPTASAPIATPTSSPPDLRLSSTRAHVGLGTAAAGVAIIGVGLIYGLQARNLFADEKGACPNLACSDHSTFELGQQYARDSRTDATVSTVLTIAGAAAVAGGITLWLTAPKSHRTETARLAPSVAPHTVGLVLGGAF